MPKNLYKRAGIWWFQKTYKGQRFRESLETESLREAQTRLAKRIAELTATHWGEKPRRTFDEAAQRFVDEHLPRLKPKSADRYMVSLGQLIPYFEGARLDEIASGKLYEFEQGRYRGGDGKRSVSKATIRRDLACLSALMSHATLLEWITINPVPAYLKGRAKKGLKESEPHTRYLDHQEEARLLPKCAEAFAEMVIFAIETGLRKEEQFSLQRHHIDLQRKEVIVDATVAKNSKTRRVPLLPRALEIARRRARQKHSPYLFPAQDGSRYSERSMYQLKLLRAAAKRAGVKPLKWHDLRRTCGCRLLQDYRMSFAEIRDWLGHSSVTVTEKAYAFLGIDDLHRAVSRHPDLPGNVVELKGE
jgi:integrase/recombinase XerD